MTNQIISIELSPKRFKYDQSVHIHRAITKRLKCDQSDYIHRAIQDEKLNNVHPGRNT